jgi:hypothetical protein
VKGAKAGVAAAAAWAACEPILGRVLGTPYSDVRLLGRAVTRGRGWPAVGLAVHLANGAAFGTAFERLGLHGRRDAVIAAEMENLVLWPVMLVVDRAHPDGRDDSWPPLFTNRRVFVYEVATHVVFGAVLGTLVRKR